MTKSVFNGVHRNEHGIQVCVQRMTDEQMKMLAMVIENMARRFVRMVRGEESK